ncbi:NAD(P)-binding protein [Ascobolus immersus RN42]|uniref:NAD(P)-binding protein n=1 Tax=Ascobolus immersus RN42 TaxID=1160509 RepID=A0A3N4IJ12_ASCIM|nr:NAD(P)-binding protein [Ascobolus immersus RN42]
MSESHPLQGKFAIVTGGARGVGERIVYTLASKGASILFTHVSSSSLEKSKSIISSLRSQYPDQVFHSLQNDISSPEGPAAIVQYAVSHFSNSHSNKQNGKLQIDVLVNNAAVAGPQSVENATAEHFHRLYNTNVLGPLLLIKTATPYLPHDRSGRIVNITSLAGKRSTRNMSVYGGTKAALDSMTRTWAKELAERATVNSVVPGPIQTEMYQVPDEFLKWTRPFAELTPLAQMTESERSRYSEDQLKFFDKLGGRPAEAQEVANAVLMVVRPESSWVTGQSIYACGGAHTGL